MKMTIDVEEIRKLVCPPPDCAFQIVHDGQIIYDDSKPNGKRKTPVRGPRKMLASGKRSIDFLLDKIKEQDGIFQSSLAVKWFRGAGLKTDGASARLSDLSYFGFVDQIGKGLWKLTEKGKRHEGPCPVRS